MWISIISECLPHQILQDICCSQYVLQQFSPVCIQVDSSQCLTLSNCCFCFCTGDEVVTVKTPAFAESVSEGDVRWEKGMYESIHHRSNIVSISQVSVLYCISNEPGVEIHALSLFVLAVGDSVNEDEVVCEIETDKV